MSLSLSVYECEYVWVWVCISFYVCWCVGGLCVCLVVSISLYVCERVCLSEVNVGDTLCDVYVWLSIWSCGWHIDLVYEKHKQTGWERARGREREILTRQHLRVCVVSVDSPCVHTFFVRIFYFLRKNIIIRAKLVFFCKNIIMRPWKWSWKCSWNGRPVKNPTRDILTSP